MPKAKTTKAKAAPAPYSRKGKTKTAKHPLQTPAKKNFGIGGDLPPKKDLTRFVKYPAYVRLQRQKAILNKRLKVPPAISAFSQVLDANSAKNLFAFLNKYQPEEKAAKKERLRKEAEETAKGGAKPSTKKTICVKSGLNHVVALCESKKLALLIIASDVDPIENVIFLPALARKLGIPWVIVNGKSRLGTVVHRKHAAVLGIPTEVRSEDKSALATLVSLAKANYVDKYEESRKHWGGGERGNKSHAKMVKRAKAAGQSAASVSKTL